MMDKRLRCAYEGSRKRQLAFDFTAPAGTAGRFRFSRIKGGPMIKLDNKQHIKDLKDRLARVKRGEVWGSDYPGPYTPKEKAAEIARIEAEIRKAESGNS